jgi:hypothetical protein
MVGLCKSEKAFVIVRLMMDVFPVAGSPSCRACGEKGGPFGCERVSSSRGARWALAPSPHTRAIRKTHNEHLQNNLA